MHLRLIKLAILFGICGLGLTVFLSVVYYMHLFSLQGVSIETMRYDALIYASVVALFILSLGLGATALFVHKERKSFWLMLTSTAIVVIGYIFPFQRLLKLGYTTALNETIIIAAFHIGLLVLSTILLKRVKLGACN